jgi:DegV family protein with EDD domain
MKIIVDSSIDQLQGLTKDYEIVPIHLYMNEKEVNLDKNDFYKLLKNNKFTTSQCNPSDFKKLIKKYENEEIIILTISSELSGTYNSAATAAKDYDNVKIIDSKTISAGLHLLVDILKNKGIKEMMSSIPKIKSFVFVKDFNNLIKSGRVNKTVGKVAGLINLKPLLELKKGKLKLKKLVITNNITKELSDFIKKNCKVKDLFIIHNNLNEEVRVLKNLLKDYDIKTTEYFTPVLGVYTGSQAIGFGWLEE